MVDRSGHATVNLGFPGTTPAKRRPGGGIYVPLLIAGWADWPTTHTTQIARAASLRGRLSWVKFQSGIMLRPRSTRASALSLSALGSISAAVEGRERL